MLPRLVADYGAEYHTVLAGSDTVIVPQGAHRMYVIFSNASANSEYFSFGQSTAGGTQGLRLSGGMPPIIITRDMIGTLIDADIHGSAGAANSNATVLIGFKG